jgi:hypothetical protein
MVFIVERRNLRAFPIDKFASGASTIAKTILSRWRREPGKGVWQWQGVNKS